MNRSLLSKHKRGKITCANISSGDHFIATGSDDGTVIIYSFDPVGTFYNMSKNLLISKIDSMTAVRFGSAIGYSKKTTPKRKYSSIGINSAFLK